MTRTDVIASGNLATRQRTVMGVLGMAMQHAPNALIFRNYVSIAGLLASVQEERARNYLRNSSLSVSEIGERLGYSEASAFSRAFSNWAGMSPLQWRRNGGPGRAGAARPAHLNEVGLA